MDRKNEEGGGGARKKKKLLHKAQESEKGKRVAGFNVPRKAGQKGEENQGGTPRENSRILEGGGPSVEGESPWLK